jgi:nitroreductase
MDIGEAIKGRRTIRKFKQDRIEFSVLKDLVDGARLAPSGANLQPLEYLVVDESERLDSVFETLKWAAYLAPYGTPGEGEKPVAYIIVLVNKNVKPHAQYDAAAAIQNILLGAMGYGIGTCWLGAVDREKLACNLNIPGEYVIDSVVALGYPAEESVHEEEQGSLKYYRDAEGKIHVPKRRLQDILHRNELNRR